VGGAAGAKECWSELRAQRERLGGVGGQSEGSWVWTVSGGTPAPFLWCKSLPLTRCFFVIFLLCGSSRYRWQGVRGYGCVCVCVVCGGGGAGGVCW